MSNRLTSHQVFVLLVAYLGWVFDLMDVFLMVLVKDRAMAELLGPGASQQEIGVWGGWALGITLVGWSVGGLLFGMVADRWGRTRTMALTILIYSVFTGLTGLAQTPTQLLVLRFIAALGIGGEWGAGASMIAEVFPKASRALAAGILQSAAGTGFFAAILLEYLVGGNWRYAFFGGAMPAFLALVVRLGLHEPEVWVERDDEARARGARIAGRIAGRGVRRAGTAAAIAARDGARDHRHLRLLGHELLGERAVHRAAARAGRRAGRDRARRALGADRPQSRQHGRLPVVHPAHQSPRPPRRVRALPHRRAGLDAGGVSVVERLHLGLVLFFFAGLFTSGIYSGYTIYFPELFPTRVRATGASFCYNVGRIVAAPGPVIMGWLTGALEKIRARRADVAYAGAIMGCVYVLAFAVIPFLPETRGVDLDRE